MFFDQDLYWAVVLASGEGSAFTVAVAEDCPAEWNVVVTLCQGYGPTAAKSAEHFMAMLPEQLASNPFDVADPASLARTTLATLDDRLGAHDESAAVGMVHVGTAQIVTAIVGGMRAFLLAPGEARELASGRSLIQRIQTLGVRPGRVPLDADVRATDLTFAHPFVLLATEETLGWLEAAGGTPKDLVRPDDTVETLRDRLARCLATPEPTETDPVPGPRKGAALILALVVKSSGPSIS